MPHKKGSRYGEKAQKFEPRDLTGPLFELAKHGRILAVMFEKDGRIEIQMWEEATPAMLKALRKTYHAIVHQWTEEIRRKIFERRT